MKLIHISDLHLGKRVNDVSMIVDQKYILEEVLKIVDQEQPDGVLIAGDVYDKAVPSAEAVEVMDEFLFCLSQRGCKVFIISGNHDSPERLAFGGRLLDRAGIHISPVYSGEVLPIILSDKYGTVNFYLLPFIKPAHVRRFFPEADIHSYTDALRTVIDRMNINRAERNILLTHQFVTGASRCESEEISVGGSDNVDASVFEGFDYVALGHIHGPQNIRDHIRYCGTPLKYSFSEVSHTKSLTIVELAGKGTVRVDTRPLLPLRDMRQLRGTYEEISKKSNYEHTATDDYLHIILTDEDDVPEAVGRLRAIYPNLMKVTYDNTRTRTNAQIDTAEDVQNKDPLELFEELYQLQNNQPMNDLQLRYARELIEKIWEGRK